MRASVHACVCACVRVCVHACVHLSVHASILVSIYVIICVYMYNVCAIVCVCVHMCILVLCSVMYLFSICVFLTSPWQPRPPQGAPGQERADGLRSLEKTAEHFKMAEEEVGRLLTGARETLFRERLSETAPPSVYSAEDADSDDIVKVGSLSSHY